MTADLPMPRAPGLTAAAGLTGAAGVTGAAAGPECHDEVCITCSDTAVAVRILRLLDDELAIVDTGAGEEEVSVALVSAVEGDSVLVHAGEAIAVVGGGTP